MTPSAAALRLTDACDSSEQHRLSYAIVKMLVNAASLSATTDVNRQVEDLFGADSQVAKEVRSTLVDVS
ncbi:MAG: hypothetical protein GX617_14275 [Lentisphaerae bacterium]|nr:hypothetical protein [Lentisphaerota bacterium]